MINLACENITRIVQLLHIGVFEKSSCKKSL